MIEKRIDSMLATHEMKVTLSEKKDNSRRVVEVLTLTKNHRVFLTVLTPLIIAFGLFGCLESETTSLGEDNNNDGGGDPLPVLTLSADCALACSTIENCTLDEFDLDNCIMTCSDFGESCTRTAQCVSSFHTGNCDYDLQCYETEGSSDCFESSDPVDAELDVCGQACLSLCGLDHSVSTCLEECNFHFEENDNCTDLWTCISEYECTRDHPDRVRFCS